MALALALPASGQLLPGVYYLALRTWDAAGYQATSNYVPIQVQ